MMTRVFVSDYYISSSGIHSADHYFFDFTYSIITISMTYRKSSMIGCSTAPET